jgi:hypothetical protein
MPGRAVQGFGRRQAAGGLAGPQGLQPVQNRPQVIGQHARTVASPCAKCAAFRAAFWRKPRFCRILRGVFESCRGYFVAAESRREEKS